MKNPYLKYINDELWLIKETEWARSLQGVRESQFSLGNGYLGSRGVLEEIPYDAMPGTYIAGIYEKMGTQVSEIVNFPNPINFKIMISGEKLDIMAMDVLEHKRILNLKKGLLIRSTLYQNSKKSRFDYSSLRFISMHNKNIGVMQINVTPLDAACELEINTGIDTSVYNVAVLTEGRKRLFRIKELGQTKNAGYLVAQTLGKKHTLVYWAGLTYKIGSKKVYAKDNIFRLKINKNQTVTFTRIFYIKHFSTDNNLSKYKEAAFKDFNKEFHYKFDDLLKKHIYAWEKLWEKADILIEGTANLQQNLRFNIYHMLTCGHEDAGFSSIGARTLSGLGYRGHIFWDTEIFLLPFYLFNFPQMAKNILLYRYKRLDKARELARKEGFRGVRFPWESAEAGDEETPEWAKDIDGSIIRIHTHKMEHHLTADISYALYRYYVATADEKFMQNYGYEIMFEAARFWASRAKQGRKKRLDIKGIIGPDEFHVGVNNNAFTNVMARWNLLTANRLFFQMKNGPGNVYQRLQKKMDLKEKEAKKWKRTASLLAMNTEGRLIEQFEGYFKLRKILAFKSDENGIPIIPEKFKSIDFAKTQLIKQADVLMLLYLLSDVYSAKTKKANYDFYIPRTMHKSSLSFSMNSIMACECQDIQRAYNLFNASLRMDISNVYGNTREGMHAACLGGTWQAVVFGFAGISIRKEKLWIDPRMPRTWRKMVFSLLWRGALVKLELAADTIRIKVISKKRGIIAIGAFNKVYCLRPNKNYTYKRKKAASAEVYYY